MKKIALSLAVASAVLLAADVDTEKENELVTHTELGYIQTSGNTNTQTFNLDAKAKKAWGKHVGELMFDGQYATQDSVETKNKFVTELTYDYEFTKRFAFNYLLGYKKDRFSGFEYQVYTGPGAKYKAIVSKVHNLTVDGNILYAKDSYETAYSDGAGGIIAYPNSTVGAPVDRAAYTNDYASYRVKGVYGWQIAQSLKFNQELTFRGSFEESDNYFAYSKSSLNAKISDIFSAGLSYKVDYVNVPADGKENTDTTVTANLIMDY